VNVHEPWELKYWSEKFGVTAEQLKGAVKKVGVTVEDIERYFERERTSAGAKQ
jgi:hypothetical protein